MPTLTSAGSIAEPSGRKSFRIKGYRNYWTIKMKEANAINAVILNDLCPLAPAIVPTLKHTRTALLTLRIANAAPSFFERIAPTTRSATE